jgi:hypothetical protein
MRQSCNVWQTAESQHGLRQHTAKAIATAACWQPACHHVRSSTFGSAAASAALATSLRPQRRCRLTRQITTAAVSPLPHYAALPLDKATHLRQARPHAARCIFRVNPKNAGSTSEHPRVDGRGKLGVANCCSSPGCAATCGPWCMQGPAGSPAAAVQPAGRPGWWCSAGARAWWRPRGSRPQPLRTRRRRRRPTRRPPGSSPS